MTYDSNGRLTYSGFYRAIVTDSNDPLNQGRVRMTIPQVTGEAVTDWAWPMGGGYSQAKYPFITLTTITDQLVTAANTATVVNFTNVEFSNGGVELVDGTKVQVAQTGQYLLQFSAVFNKSNSTAANVDIWYRYNGTDIPRSNTRCVTTGNPNEVTITVAGIMPLQAGDYVQIAFSSADAGVKLKSFTNLTNPVRPDMPGIVFSANLVGDYKPAPGTTVWAAFEGGDPNFPLWIGSF